MIDKAPIPLGPSIHGPTKMVEVRKKGHDGSFADALGVTIVTESDPSE